MTFTRFYSLFPFQSDFHRTLRKFALTFPRIFFFAFRTLLRYSVVNLRMKRAKARFLPTGARLEAAAKAALVGSSGLEPPTSRLSGVCSNLLSYEPVGGGGKRIRTDDPLLAGQVLYQLSYTPIYINAGNGDNIKQNALTWSA